MTTGPYKSPLAGACKRGLPAILSMLSIPAMICRDPANVLYGSPCAPCLLYPSLLSKLTVQQHGSARQSYHPRSSSYLLPHALELMTLRL